MYDPVTIIDSSTWSEALSTVLSGVLYLDSIILFDFGSIRTTFLDFDIALCVFGIMWNTVGLWHYDFDSAYDMSVVDSSPEDVGKEYDWITIDNSDDVPEREPELDIPYDDDDE